MGVIASIEDAVINELQSKLGNYVREIDSMPGPWSADILRRLLQQAPGVYVSWLGGKAMESDPDAMFDSRLDVIAVTKNARGEEARRRGGAPNEVGAYDLIEIIAPALHGYVVPDAGSLSMDQVDNVFTEATFDLGATVYVVRFKLPVVLPVELDLDALAGFKTFHSESDVAPEDDDVNTTDQDAEIPQ